MWFKSFDLLIFLDTWQRIFPAAIVAWAQPHMHRLLWSTTIIGSFYLVSGAFDLRFCTALLHKRPLINFSFTSLFPFIRFYAFVLHQKGNLVIFLSVVNGKLIWLIAELFSVVLLHVNNPPPVSMAICCIILPYCAFIFLLSYKINFHKLWYSTSPYRIHATRRSEWHHVYLHFCQFCIIALCWYSADYANRWTTLLCKNDINFDNNKRSHAVCCDWLPNSIMYQVPERWLYLDRNNCEQHILRKLRDVGSVLSVWSVKVRKTISQLQSNHRSSWLTLRIETWVPYTQT